MPVIETYTLEMTVLSPVHIGTGERPDQKTRWEADGRLWLVDEDALFGQIAARPQVLDAFERFCLDDRGRLSAFLAQANIAPRDVALYDVPRWGTPASRDYYPYLKKPGKPPVPYIPGSSLKGAFRTAALRGMLLTSPRRRAAAEDIVRRQLDRRGRKERADDELERTFFGPDQHREWLRLFQFTDTAELGPDALAVTDVHILSVQGTGAAARLEEKAWKPGRPVTSHPEVLRPGVKLSGHVHYLAYLTSAVAQPELQFNAERRTVDALFRYSNVVAQEAIEQEWTFAQQTRWQDGQMFYGWLLDEHLAKLAPGECLLRLGWGTGFDSQTVTDLFAEGTFHDVLNAYRLTVGRPGRDLQRDPLPNPFSPKSRQVALDARGRWQPLGWVKIRRA